MQTSEMNFKMILKKFPDFSHFPYYDSIIIPDRGIPSHSEKYIS